MKQSRLEIYRDNIFGMLEAGFTKAAIANDLGVPRTTLRDFIAQAGEEKDARVLIIDIETRPALAYVWDVWNQNIGPRQIVEDKATISFAAKWRGESKCHFWSDHHDGHEAMVQAAWDLLDQADIVVHYNGYKFDIPHLNQEFLLAGMAPPSGYYQLDLLKTIRTEFNFTSNKLDNIADKTLHARKVEHEGFDLWRKCLSGDGDAWNRMRRYNVGDVKLTEQLFDEIHPWIKSVNLPKKYAINHTKIGDKI